MSSNTTFSVNCTDEYNLHDYVRTNKIPDEIIGDVFDRQRVICEFSQGKIESLRCLVLGTGGIGQNVAMLLSRLGVASIVLVDCDCMEASNLPRQVLGNLHSIGNRKADISKDTIENHFNLRSSVQSHNIDAVLEWDRIVALALNADVIFNSIDAGSFFDLAVCSLSKALRIPMVQGQSCGWMAQSEFWTGQLQHRCLDCDVNILDSMFCLSNVQFDNFWQGYEVYRDHSRQSNMHSNELDNFIHYLTLEPKIRVSSEITSNIIKSSWPSEINGSLTKSDARTLLTTYKDAAKSLILPSNIMNLKSLSFLPCPELISTRIVGSWICPCSLASNFMVTQVVNYMTGPEDKNPPISILFDLSTGQTASFGDTPKCRDKPEDTCFICSDAKVLHEKLLFYSNEPIRLHAVSGSERLYDTSVDNPLDAFTSSCCVSETNGQFDIDLGILFGEEYNTICIDAVPVKDIDDSAIFPSSSLDCVLGGLFAKKENKDNAPSIQGYASGQRSALVFGKQGKVYRLKGCGMKSGGFPVVDVLDDDGKHVVTSSGAIRQKLRGCCYDNTSSVELIMTDFVSRILKDRHFVCGNIPIAKWVYSISDSEPYAKLPRCCTMFETYGDRRVGDHLLRGLELLLSYLIPNDFSNLDDVLKTLNETGLVFDHRVITEQSMNPNKWEAYDTRFTHSILMMSDICIESASQFVDCRESEFLNSLQLPNDMPTVLSAQVEGLWHSITNTLQTMLSSNQLSIGQAIAKLYYSIGKQCGQIFSIFQEHGIVWGTFSDATGFHANAHANNFIMVDPSKLQNANFLAPVDFDMAFLKETSIYATKECKMSFEDLSNIERAELGMNLAGSSSTTGTKPLVKLRPTAALIRICLRDTLVRGWLTGLFGEDVDNTHCHDVMLSLIKLALLFTTNLIA